MVLAGTGLWIGYNGLYKVFAANYKTLAIPGLFALAAAILSILVKEGMFWYTKRAADRIHSAALMADAWHHRSDCPVLHRLPGGHPGLHGWASLYWTPWPA